MQSTTAAGANEPSGRERSFIELARRAQIVSEAIRTIEDVGYARASLGQIAQSLGISKGVISYHFASKDELIQEVIRTSLELGSEHLAKWLESAETETDKLRAYITGNLAFFRDHRAHAVALVEIYTARAADYRPDGQRSVTMLEDLLARGQRTGEFRDFSTRVMATIIRTAIEIVPVRIATDDDVDLDEYARELVDVFTLATSANSQAKNDGRGPLNRLIGRR